MSKQEKQQAKHKLHKRLRKIWIYFDMGDDGFVPGTVPEVRMCEIVDGCYDNGGRCFVKKHADGPFRRLRGTSCRWIF